MSMNIQILLFLLSALIESGVDVILARDFLTHTRLGELDMHICDKLNGNKLDY